MCRCCSAWGERMGMKQQIPKRAEEMGTPSDRSEVMPVRYRIETTGRRKVPVRGEKKVFTRYG
jgi:hypothetical protein